jgi:hypothetical protein
VDVEQIASDEWEAAAVREVAVRRLLALPDGQRTGKAVARESCRLGLSIACMFRRGAAWGSEPCAINSPTYASGPEAGSLRTPLDKRTMAWHTRLQGLMSVGIADVAVGRIRLYHRPVASGYSANSILPGVTLPRGRLF